MRLKSFLLYSLIFSYSSVFSANVDNVNGFVFFNGIHFDDTMKITTLIEHYDSAGNLRANIGSYPAKYYSMPSSGVIQFTTKGVCGGSYCHYTYDKYNVTTDSCPPEIPFFNTETYICEAPPPPICEPEDNQVLNPDTNTCECVDGFVMHNGVCSPDTDGDGIPDVTDDDIDGDGIPNDNDPDIDGDGIPNDTDKNPNSPDGNTPDELCKGMDLTTRVYFGTKFNISDYHSKGYKFPNTCSLYLSQEQFDSAFEYSDINPNCTERKYCYVHYADEDDKTKCSYSASDVKPNGFVYVSNLNEDECIAKVDNTKYIDYKYILPHSIACPGVAYCFLKPKIDSPDDSNTEDEDDTMDDNLDLNSTSTDNKALLQASNTSNKHLSDLKDKVDLTNKSLEKINETNTNLLASSKDINKNLTNTNDTLSNSLTQQKLMNETLSNINKAMSNSNLNTKSLNSIALKNNSQLQNIASNNRAINENLQAGLFGDENPFGEIDDGLADGLSDIESTVQGSLNGFVQSNIFPFVTSSYSVPTINMSLSYGSFTLFSAETLNMLPIDALRALIIFSFAMAGFITVFRTV